MVYYSAAGSAALGYFFHPRRHPESPGHPQLDVVLRPEPTRRHFDPEWIALKVAVQRARVGHLTVHHPWRRLSHRFRTCAGRVVWGDRKGETIAAFTFGGELRIQSKETYTLCTLASPAPILSVSRRFSIPAMLALEVEVLLAERRAAWVHDLESYDKRLAAAEPSAIYRACLRALEEKFQDLTGQVEIEFLDRFTLFMCAERDRLGKVWGRSPDTPTLSELL
jgi:hypothetical protein